MTEVLRDLETDVLRLIQITDSHLFGDADSKLVGIKSDESFLDVVALIAEQENHFDALLCTGDIAQDASVAAYLRFHDALLQFKTPQFWIPGNHDLMSRMQEALSKDHDCLRKSIPLGKWQIIMLNSCVEGEVHGQLSETELAFLAHELQTHKAKHIFICLHHNCVPVKARWLQKHALQNSESFFEVTDQYENVRAIAFGHIHQDINQLRNNVHILGTPSSSIQFHPEHDEFSLDNINPGYRWLDLHANGKVETGVKRVTGKLYNVDLSSLGY